MIIMATSVYSCRYVHTYMNWPITAPGLESRKLKCVQVHERVQMDTGLSVAS